MSIAPSPSIVTLPESAAGMHVLDFLAERFPRIETVVWRRRMAEDKVSWEDGSAVRPEALCRPGARIFYFREVEAEPVIPFAEEILFADDHLLVADKPPFLPVHPAGRWVNECLLHRLRRATGIEALAPLHRLDRDTSGLVLFSTNAETRPLYHRLFEDSAVERGYQALARVTAAPREREWWCRSRIVAGSPFFRMREAPGPPNATTRATRHRATALR